MIEEFKKNGFYKVNDKEVFKYLKDFESWEWKNLKEQGLRLVKRNVLVENDIRNTQILLAEKYVKHIDPNFQYGDDCEIVNGMDEATLSWHNDNIEGYNLSILLYLDDMDEDIGGDISFRDIKTKEYIDGFYPKRYDVSFMNHNLNFEHIVNPLKLDVPRRVALFNYKINKDISG